ncbi:hypothetical protein Zmor_025961 [Zophobas morio]|uniref:Uncharacterized protein n=1 Tax=Zophobas morio TaxID=2755281 RepID=A0AA38M5L2_9CUCU|nr:hypothetical protein Zmor_025961 [Zophobas morio]
MKQAQRTRRETRTGRPWKTDCAIRRDRLIILLWIKFVSLLGGGVLFTFFSLLWPLRRIDGPARRPPGGGGGGGVAAHGGRGGGGGLHGCARHRRRPEVGGAPTDEAMGPETVFDVVWVFVKQGTTPNCDRAIACQKTCIYNGEQRLGWGPGRASKREECPTPRCFLLLFTFRGGARSLGNAGGGGGGELRRLLRFSKRQFF